MKKHEIRYIFLTRAVFEFVMRVVCYCVRSLMCVMFFMICVCFLCSLCLVRVVGVEYSCVVCAIKVCWYYLYICIVYKCACIVYVCVVYVCVDYVCVMFVKKNS